MRKLDRETESREFARQRRQTVGSDPRFSSVATDVTCSDSTWSGQRRNILRACETLNKIRMTAAEASEVDRRRQPAAVSRDRHFPSFPPSLPSPLPPFLPSFLLPSPLPFSPVSPLPPPPDLCHLILAQTRAISQDRVVSPHLQNGLSSGGWSSTGRIASLFLRLMRKILQ